MDSLWRGGHLLRPASVCIPAHLLSMRRPANRRCHSFTRIHYLGVKRDDFVMCLCFIAYTTLIICLNMIILGGGSNLFPPELFATFTPAEIKERIKGSKVVLVSEQAMLITIWTAKACMLLFYSILTCVFRW